MLWPLMEGGEDLEGALGAQTTSCQSAGTAALPPATAAAAAAAAAAGSGLAPSAAVSAASAATSIGGSRGKTQRGPRPRLFRKNCCQADGCAANLSACAFYLQVRRPVCCGTEL